MGNDTFVSWLDWINAFGLGLLATLVTFLVVAFVPLSVPDPVPIVVGVVVALAYQFRHRWSGVVERA